MCVYKIALKRFRHKYLGIKLMRALMKLWAECFGSHRILDAWSQGQLPRGGDSPEVSGRISVCQAGGAAQKRCGRNFEGLLPQSRRELGLRVEGQPQSPHLQKGNDRL